MSLVTATEALDGEKRLESRAFDHVCKTTVDTFRTTGNNVNLHDQIITSTKPHIVSLQRIRTKKPLALFFFPFESERGSTAGQIRRHIRSIVGLLSWPIIRWDDTQKRRLVWPNRRYELTPRQSCHEEIIRAAGNSVTRSRMRGMKHQRDLGAQW